MSLKDSAFHPFRNAIALHLSPILSQPSEKLESLIQQSTTNRKPDHSVFSLVLKRLGHHTYTEDQLEACTKLSPETEIYISRARRTKDMLLFDPVPLKVLQSAVDLIHKDLEPLATSSSASVLNPQGKRDRSSGQAIVIQGSAIHEDENPYSQTRRAVLTGFLARLLAPTTEQNPVKVVIENDGNGFDVDLLKGLDLLQEPASDEQLEVHLEKIKMAFMTNATIQAQLKDGTWIVDLTNINLGVIKVFTEGEPSGTMGAPTPIVRALAKTAHHFATLDCSRYLWVVPDSRWHMADQILHLAKVIFSKSSLNDEEEPWCRLIERVHYGPISGTDISKAGQSGMTGLMGHVNTRMTKVVQEARLNHLSDEDEEDNAEDLDEASLQRMASVLGSSALTFACAGGRRSRKLNIDLAKILDGKGNSGVFLQYVLARLHGIESKSLVKLNPEANVAVLQHSPEALDLALVLMEWRDIQTSLQDLLDPFVLVTYLFQLAAQVGQANRVLRVKDMTPAVAEPRWLLFWCAKRILEHSFYLFGLEPAERM